MYVCCVNNNSSIEYGGGFLSINHYFHKYLAFIRVWRLTQSIEPPVISLIVVVPANVILKIDILIKSQESKQQQFPLYFWATYLVITGMK